ncbi:hypothetical protein BH09GEM1_BH09GEM1_43140 [soil metagenome]
MPVDLARSTNTPTATLEMRQAQPLGDGHHLAAFLLVRSGAFAAALPFVFSLDELLSFAEALDALGSTRAGAAHLRSSENDDVIRFESAEVGVLRIAGDLHETSGAQRLTFSFVADWEGLAAFTGELRQLRSSHA